MTITKRIMLTILIMIGLVTIISLSVSASEVSENLPAIEEVSEAITEEPEATEEPTAETPVDQIPDDLYQSYVLGCLFFFVTVILFYFAYKFFKMFF